MYRNSVLLRLMGLCMLSVSAVCNSYAEVSRHVVQRGETWGTICRDYGITIDMLKKSNTWINSDADCAAGLEVDVPLVGLEGDRMMTRMLASDSRYIEAQSLYAAGEYKKAVKIYDGIIKNDSRPYAAFFLRGRAQMMRGKYGKAVDDLRLARIEMPFSNVESLLDEASRLKEEQDARRSEMWGAIALGVAQAGMEITNAYMEQERQQEVRKNREKIAKQYEIVTPKGNVIRPPESMMKLMNGEYDLSYNVTYDQYGNPMISSPGGAQYTEDMARETARMTAEYATKNPTATNIANARWAESSLRMQLENAQYERTPHYLMDVDMGELIEDSERQRKERREYYESEREDTRKHARELTAAMMHTHVESSGTTSSKPASTTSSTYSSSSSRIASSSSSSANRSTGWSNTSNSSTSRKSSAGDVLDSKQQFKNDRVSSDDYTEIKKVDLYIQDGNTFRAMMQNMPLCKKGAQKFVKIGNTYFLKMRSNNSRFSSSIVYGGKALYFSD